ncbi:hypothetical protein JWJ90_13330 [Desulfobulbus rhabdoformis]|jgi:reverse gyrase|uniref:hypothetical protein n=1 Tax=Desulfobulbus rhabdoformis TaxID=34032 RepID=UPI001966A1A9|nr:hypothetical protein [Desulfobulbus rhabdoformis]MBM9615262.1 hypothetical protein [Desulfobulbus rhabdoformis]
MTLLAKEQKKMLEKVSVAVQELLRKLDDRWTGTEISQRTGIAHSRISEYRDYEKYQRPVSLSHLIKFIGNGLFTMTDVIDATEGLSVKEQEFLQDLGFYEDLALRRLVVEVKKEEDVSPLEVYSTLATLKSKGVNIKQMLSKLREED